MPNVLGITGIRVFGIIFSAIYNYYGRKHLSHLNLLTLNGVARGMQGVKVRWPVDCKTYLPFGFYPAFEANNQ